MLLSFLAEKLNKRLAGYTSFKSGSEGLERPTPTPASFCANESAPDFFKAEKYIEQNMLLARYEEAAGQGVRNLQAMLNDAPKDGVVGEDCLSPNFLRSKKWSS